MEQAIMETVLQVVATLLITLIGVLGTWLTAQIAKNKQLAGVAAATDQVILAAQTTVGELQQTIVDKLKANGGGKLSDEQIAVLGKALLDKTMEKLSLPTIQFLKSASVDINALITGAGEAWIAKIKAP
ncbi:MAG TPA: hypothetical protein PKB13_06820 [Clostridia bacterium]|nr:hypothetical protein [Clostridia bacterium]